MDIDVTAKLNDLNGKILALQDASDNSWQVVKKSEKDNLVIWSKSSSEFNGKIFKGEGMIDASPETCFQHCNPKPGTTRASWDTSIKNLEMVKAIQLDQWPEAYILRTMSHSAVMGLISGRDFVDIIINVNNDTVVGTMAESVETELCPPTKDFVRGRNHYCGILSYRVPGDPNKTRVVFIAHSEIGGMIPISLVESAVPSAISDFFSNLKKQIKLK